MLPAPEWSLRSVSRVRTIIVVPTYEEAGNVEELLRRLRVAAPDADVLVVDDNSPDQTAAVATAVGREIGNVDVLLRGAKDGLGSAYRAGFARALDAGYDIVVQMDADLSHDPATVPTLVDRVTAGADVAIGARYVPGGSIPNWTPLRRGLSRFGNRYATRMLRLGISDATSGFRAYSASAIRAVDIANTRTNGYGFQIEVAHRAATAGLSMTEVPIVFSDRVRGRSKMSLRIVGEALWSVTTWGLRERLRGPRGRGRSADLEPRGREERHGHDE